MTVVPDGADVNVADGEGRTLLHKTIVDQKSKGALFLLNNGADVELRCVLQGVHKEPFRFCGLVAPM